MKEKIYTIPVNDAFNEECECPLCSLEEKLELQALDYYLGPSLMEPDHRIDTNEKGFCRRHFELLYNREENTLGLALIIETHLEQQNEPMLKDFEKNAKALSEDSKLSLTKSIGSKLSSKKTAGEKYIDSLIGQLEKRLHKCAICSKLQYTMDRYIDVILYLYFEEKEFMEKFKSKKGFCIYHLKMLLEGAKKYLPPKKSASFVYSLIKMQTENMNRLHEEVNWFTKKFDYRYSKEPWKNSKDAVPRAIAKLVGYFKSTR